MAMKFVKASAQYVATGATSAIQNVSAASISCWINAASYGPDGNRNKIVTFAANTTSTRFSIAWDSAAKGIGALGKALDGDGLQQWNSNYALNNNQWYHVVVRCDFVNKIYTEYIDSALVATSGAMGWTAGNTSNTTSSKLVIGSAVGVNTEFFDGIIDDVRVYNRLLTLADIQTIFTCKGNDNIFTGLQVRYTLHEGYETQAATGAGVVKDSFNVLNGTPGGNPTYIGSPLKWRT